MSNRNQIIVSLDPVWVPRLHPCLDRWHREACGPARRHDPLAEIQRDGFVRPTA